MDDELIGRAREATYAELRRLAQDPRSEQITHAWNGEADGGSVPITSTVADALCVPKDNTHLHAITLAVRWALSESEASGFIVASTADQRADFSARSRRFQFTPLGRRVLGREEVRLHEPGSLRAALLAQRGAGSLQVEDHEVELLAEAQHCWETGCFRAAAVLIGLANESRCLDLVDALVQSLPAPSTPDIQRERTAAMTTSSLFSARWRPTLKLLALVRGDLRNAGGRQDWWPLWDGIPGTLSTLGEAVRLTRNTAAHDPHSVFTRADIALLIAAMPYQIQLVNSLAAFLRAPPAGVTLPVL